MVRERPIAPAATSEDSARRDSASILTSRRFGTPDNRSKNPHASTRKLPAPRNRLWPPSRRSAAGSGRTMSPVASFVGSQDHGSPFTVRQAASTDPRSDRPILQPLLASPQRHHPLRCRIRARIRRFLRPSFRRPFPVFLTPMLWLPLLHQSRLVGLWRYDGCSDIKAPGPEGRGGLNPGRTSFRNRASGHCIASPH